MFWEKGYSKTSIADLATATEVDKKCLFREFTNKGKLFEEVLKLYRTGKQKPFDTLLNKEPLGLENIKNFLQSMKIVPQVTGCLLNKSVVQHNLIDDSHFEIIQGAYDYLEWLLEKNLAAAKQSNQLVSTRSPSELAKYFIY